MPKVLVIDDSALMRKRLSQMLETRKWQVSTARNGAQALDMVEACAPDVITLDINMPEMDGLTFLGHLMHRRPTPVVMVSSLTEAGALATFEALQLGAVDYVHKPDGTVSLDLHRVEEEICAKVAAAARARLLRPGAVRRPAPAARPQRPAPAAGSAPGQTPEKLVLVGASTGGPRALEELISALPGDFPAPILICQHMPAAFTGPFAARLDQIAALRVQEVTSPTTLAPGTVYIGRGDADVVLMRRAGNLMATSVPSDGRPWHPSIGRLVETALAHMPAERLVGVMLTGMGDDGTPEMTKLRRGGGRTVAQDEETSVVFGMPAALIAAGGAETVLPLARIPARIGVWLNRAQIRRGA